MAFVVKKNVSLAFLGSGWEEAFIDFSGLTFNEVRQFAKLQLDTENPDNEANLDMTVKLLEKHFIAGRGWNGQGLVEINKKDLGELPVDALTKSVQALVGTNENLT